MGKRARPNGHLQQPAAAEREVENPKPPRIAGTTAGSNADARADVIRTAFQKLDVLDGDIEKLKADLKVKTKARSDVFRDLKSDVGMKREDAEFARRLAKLDTGERDEALDTIREIHAALGIGEQADFIDALARTGAGATKTLDEPPVDPMARIYMDAYHLGHEAKGMLADNPFDETVEPEKQAKWAEGWKRGQADRMKESPLTGGAPAPAEAETATA